MNETRFKAYASQGNEPRPASIPHTMRGEADDVLRRGADRGGVGVSRPSAFTQEIGDAVCDRLADGQSLRAICLDEAMPSQSMVFRWLGDNEQFREQYARAREAQADALFDEMLDIADDGTNDWMEIHREDDDENAGWRVNGEHIQRSKLRIDARKWMASKLQPKKYGDKITQEHTGPGGSQLIPQINVTIGKPGSEPSPKAG